MTASLKFLMAAPKSLPIFLNLLVPKIKKTINKTISQCVILEKPIKTAPLVMKTASQLISELKSLQLKYGEDFKIRLTVKDYYSVYGEEMEDNFSNFFNGDFMTMTYSLKKQKHPFSNEIKNPKITFRK